MLALENVGVQGGSPYVDVLRVVKKRARIVRHGLQTPGLTQGPT